MQEGVSRSVSQWLQQTHHWSYCVAKEPTRKHFVHCINCLNSCCLSKWDVCYLVELLEDTTFLQSQVTSSTATTCGQTSICFLQYHLLLLQVFLSQRNTHTHTHTHKVSGERRRLQYFFTVAENCTQSLQKHGKELIQSDQPSSELTQSNLHTSYLCPMSCGCCAVQPG